MNKVGSGLKVFLGSIIIILILVFTFSKNYIFKLFGLFDDNYIVLKDDDLEKQNEAYNGKKVFFTGIANYNVTDNDYNISVNEYILNRIVQKWDGKKWEFVSDENNNKESSNTFISKIQLGRYAINGVEVNRLSSLPTSLLLDLEKSNIIIPNNYLLQNCKDLDYPNKYDSMKNCISNSKNINNPDIGDVRIYFASKSPLGIMYGFGKIDNNQIIISKTKYDESRIVYCARNLENEEDNIDCDSNLEDSADNIDFVNSRTTMNLVLKGVYFSSLVIKLFFVLLLLLSFVGFWLLLSGIFNLNKDRFKNIKKYQIILLSLFLGVAFTIIIFLI